MDKSKIHQITDGLVARQIQDNLHAMLTWFLSPKSKILQEVDGGHCIKMISKNISLGYKNMPFNDSECVTETIAISAIDEAEYIKKDKDYLYPVIELKRFSINNLKKYLSVFLIHGSIATLDYSKGWSDLDTYLVINKETLFDSERLLELREKLLEAYFYLLEIDPLQHHGFLVCTDLDLKQYPSYYLPTEVIKKSKSLFGQSQITFEVLSNSIGLKERFYRHIDFFKKTYESGILKHHPYNGEYLLDNFSNRDNAMYQMKNFLEFATLLPAYYLEARGRPCYKKHSFDLTRPYIPDQNWELIEKASFIRLEWQRREAHPYKGNRIPDWLIEALGSNYFKRMYDLVNVLGESLKNG